MKRAGARTGTVSDGGGVDCEVATDAEDVPIKDEICLVLQLASDTERNGHLSWRGGQGGHRDWRFG
jgi:hypothetical protein